MLHPISRAAEAGLALRCKQAGIPRALASHRWPVSARSLPKLLLRRRFSLASAQSFRNILLYSLESGLVPLFDPEAQVPTLTGVGLLIDSPRHAYD